VAKIITYPNFDSATFKNDLAILELEQDVPSNNENVGFLCLNEQTNTRTGPERYAVNIPIESETDILRLSGIGELDKLPHQVQRELTMALSMISVFHIVRKNIKTAAQVEYTSLQRFKVTYPYRKTKDTDFRDHDLKEINFTGALPENNPRGEVFWTDVFLNPSGHGLMVTCAAPIYDGSRFLGAISIDLKLDALNYFVANIIYPYGRMIVVNERETVLADSMTNQTTDEIILKATDVLPEGIKLDKIKQQRDNFLVRNGKYWVFHAPSAYAPWTVVYFVSARELSRATLLDVGPGFLALFLFATIILFAINRWIAVSFIGPTRRLVAHITSQGALELTPDPKLKEPWRAWMQAVTEVFATNRQLVTELERTIASLDRKVADRTKALSDKNTKLQLALSDLKRAQDQIITQEKLAGLGALTAGIAHEIRNPLNFILNFTRLSREYVAELQNHLKTTDNQEIQGLLQDIEANMARVEAHSLRAEGIVRSMLLHARGGEEKATLTDINSCVQESAHFALTSYKHQGRIPQLIFDLDPNVPSLLVYPQELGRVILNIVNNACYALDQHYTPKGSEPYPGMIQISTHKSESLIDIRIRDNGPGIPDKIRKKIFDPFFTTKPTGSGTGLGLSLAHEIITKQHGGSLRLETKLGSGTEFIVSLPLADDHPFEEGTPDGPIG
ncbi:MAG: ATP-binding protein, partial [Holosporales bacterium]